MLEVGPGIGFFTLELARLVGSSGRVITVECPATDDCRFAATRSQGGSWPAASMPVWFRQYRSGPRCSTWVDQHFGGWTDRQMKPRGSSGNGSPLATSTILPVAVPKMFRAS
jgi:hypothetical protein